MRFNYILLFVVVTFFESCSAATGATSLVGPIALPSTDTRFLRTGQADAKHSDNTLTKEEEERAFDLKKTADGLVFSGTYLNIMKLNNAFKLKVFEKWDHYTMEQIKRAIGEARLNNKGTAKMMVDYVQNHRYYTNW